jgi:acetyl esterase/lipase
VAIVSGVAGPSVRGQETDPAAKPSPTQTPAPAQTPPTTTAENPASTQETPPGTSAAKPADADSGPRAHRNVPGAVQPHEYGQFESLGGAELSADGRWVAYSISRVNEESELRIRMLATDSTDVVPNATNPKFSGDSQWLIYSIGVGPAEREKKEKAKEPIEMKLEMRHLVSGDKLSVDKVASFGLSDDGRFLVMRKYPGKDRKSSGVDIVVRDLASDRSQPVDINFGNVSQYAFNRDGHLLAMVIDAEDKAGNGVQVYDCQNAILRTLISSPHKYNQLIWRKKADDLAVMREYEHDEKEDAAFAVFAWRGLQAGVVSGKWNTLRYLPDARDQHPAEMRVVDLAGLTWADDGATLFFGIKPWDKKPKTYGAKATQQNNTEAAKSDKTEPASVAATSAEKTVAADGAKPAPADAKDAAKTAKSLRESLTEPAGVEVWHARDIDIIPLQKKQLTRDKNENHLAAWWLAEDRFVVLGSELTERVTLHEDQKRALGYDNTPYQELKKFGPSLNDLYLIDTHTGERELIVKQNKFAFHSSPNGRFVLYCRDHHWWLFDSQDKSHHNLTEGLDVPFHDYKDSTLTEEKMPWGVGGWTTDSTQVLLYDEFDIWAFHSDRSAPPRRITQGREQKLRHRRVVLNPVDEPHVKTDEPFWISLYGDWTKQSGYGRVSLNDPAARSETIVLRDKSIGRLIKAKQADVWAFVEQAVDDSPDLFVGSARLAEARPVSTTNPFQSKYSWSRSELVEYTNDHGEKLQGALYYPAGYEAGKKYPMIVYIYEERSQALHNYTVPAERRPYNNATFTADGFFVFEPDIVYRPQNPGLSAVECVVPAVRKVLETGMIDEKRVGLVGHSWGAYQTAFIVTQTDVFAAGIAGAPLTNMMSMSMSIYWNSGQTDAWIFHESQGRMDRPFWQDVDTYIKNSPIFNIERLKTPLLIAFGDEDGAVDFNQGVELYNAARLAGKPLVMLVYPGENHGLAKKPNQVDYHYRIREWFGHYLRGDEPAKWITDGQKHLDRLKEIERMDKKPK